MAKENQKTKEKILEELKANPKAIAFLSVYDEKSADSFLESYANTKRLLLEHGETWRKWDDEDYYREWAEDLYWIIAQKKLFNLQCQWRAGQISLPIINSWEFLYWEENIKSCPLIEDATPEEIDVLIKYLESATYHDIDNLPHEWQNHYEFRDEETGIGAGDYYPDWYHFYDTHFGTQGLILLPDTMGEIEDKYRAIWRNRNGYDRETPPPKKPHIESNLDLTEPFIREVEDYQLLDYYRMYNARQENEFEKEQLGNIIDRLFKEPETVPIPAGPFPDAIFQANHLLKVKYMKVLIPEVHQNHLDRKAMGITYEQTSFKDDLTHFVQSQIEFGKEKLGEK
ncbi:MAG: hypothetical protein HYZ44_02775 [Bacteroidetes bacterium]|nr:hypothetical protein [Bacteroidota bacterium]